MSVMDLDIHVPENKRVRLGGKEYEIPGDLPMAVFLRLNAAGDEQEDDQSAAVIRLLDAIGDLFAWLAPVDMKEARAAEVKSILEGRGVKFLMETIRHIYTDDEVEVADGDGDASEASPTEAGTGTPSTTS